MIPVLARGRGVGVRVFVDPAILDAADFAFTYGAGRTSEQRKANLAAFREIQDEINTGAYTTLTLPEQTIEVELHADSWEARINDPNSPLCNVVMQIAVPLIIEGAGGIPHPDLRMNKLPTTDTGTIIDIYPKDVQTFNAAGLHIGGFHDRVAQAQFGPMHDWSGFTMKGAEKYTNDNDADKFIELFRQIRIDGIKSSLASPVGIRSSRFHDVHLWSGNGFSLGVQRHEIDRCSTWDIYETDTLQNGSTPAWLGDTTYVFLDVTRCEWHMRPPDEAVRVGGAFGNPSQVGPHWYISPHLSYHFHSIDGEDNVFWPSGRFAIYENGEETGIPEMGLSEDVVFLGSTIQVGRFRSRENPMLLRRCTWEQGFPAHNSFAIQASVTFEDCDLTGIDAALNVASTTSAGAGLLKLVDCTGSTEQSGTFFILKLGVNNDDDVLIDGGSYTAYGTAALIMSHQNAGAGGEIHLRGVAIAADAAYAPSHAMFRCEAPSVGATTWIIEGTAENPIVWNMTHRWFGSFSGVAPANIEFRGGEFITFDGGGVAADWCATTISGGAGTITYTGATSPTFQNFTGTPTQPDPA